MTQPTGLIRATPADIEAIMAIERRPGFEDLVGRWSAERHQAEMARPGSLYLLLRSGAELEGFALLQELDSPDDAAYLKRIAVHSPGVGTGGRLLDSLLAWLFTDTAINRLELHVFPENERAKRAYLAAGFEIEGLCRDRFRRSAGGHRPAVQMAVLRRDWQERNSPETKRWAAPA